MAAQAKPSTSSWLEADEVWLFCIEKEKFTIPLRDIPSLTINVRIGHVSPVNKPMIRRRILLADHDRFDAELPNISPLLLLVDNSCDFKVYSILSNEK